MSLTFFLLLFLTLTTSKLYNNCSSYTGLTPDSLLICQLFQNINLTATTISSFDLTQPNYCGTIIDTLVIQCIDNNITSFTLKNTNVFGTLIDANIDYSNGWPLNIKTIDLTNLYPTNGFDFSSIIGLNKLEILLLSGQNNKKGNEPDITISENDWLNIAMLPNLKVFDISYRAYKGDMSVINSFNGPLELLYFASTELYGGFNWNVFDSISTTLQKLRAWSVGGNNQGRILTGKINLDPFTKPNTKIDEIKFFNNRFTGNINTTNGIPLQSTINIFELHKNLLTGEVNWNIFNQSSLLTSLKLSENNLRGSIDWSIIKYLSQHSLTKLWLNVNSFDDQKADFRGLTFQEFRLDVDVLCDSSIYCPEKYGYFSTVRKSDKIGKSDGNDYKTGPECSCQCKHSITGEIIITPLCVGQPSFPPTIAPTNAPSNTPTIITDIPTNMPTIEPTMFPSNIPTLMPIKYPTLNPVTNNPSINPSMISDTGVIITTLDSNLQNDGISPNVWLTIGVAIILIVVVTAVVCCMTCYCCCKTDHNKAALESNIHGNTAEGSIHINDTHATHQIIPADGKLGDTITKTLNVDDYDEKGGSIYSGSNNNNDEKESELHSPNQMKQDEAQRIILMEMTKILDEQNKLMQQKQEMSNSNQNGNNPGNMGIYMGHAKDGDGNFVTGMDNDMFKIFLSLSPQEQDIYLQKIQMKNQNIGNMLNNHNMHNNNNNMGDNTTNVNKTITENQSVDNFTVKNPLPKIVSDTNPNTPINHRFSVPSLPPTIPPNQNDNYQTLLFDIQENPNKQQINNNNNLNNNNDDNDNIVSPMIQLKQSHNVLHPILNSNNNDTQSVSTVSYDPETPQHVRVQQQQHQQHQQQQPIPKPSPPIDAYYRPPHKNHQKHVEYDESEISSYHPKDKNKQLKNRFSPINNNDNNNNIQKIMKMKSPKSKDKYGKYKNVNDNDSNRYVLNQPNSKTFDDYANTNTNHSGSGPLSTTSKSSSSSSASSSSSVSNSKKSNNNNNHTNLNTKFFGKNKYYKQRVRTNETTDESSTESSTNSDNESSTNDANTQTNTNEQSYQE